MKKIKVQWNTAPSLFNGAGVQVGRGETQAWITVAQGCMSTTLGKSRLSLEDGQCATRGNTGEQRRQSGVKDVTQM